MKKLILVAFLFIASTGFAQKVNKLITEKNVARIITTLSADDMMGRSARVPAQIEKATAFIESEFKKIGLQPLKGLTGFRQEFQKEQISPSKLEVVVDGERIAQENLILVSEKTEINIEKGLSIKSIDFDSQAPNKDQYFFDKAFGLARDTSSCIILIAPEFQANFKEFKGYFGKRFLNNRKSTKVFVFGKSKAAAFSVKASQKIEIIKMTNVVGMLEGKTKLPVTLESDSVNYDERGLMYDALGMYKEAIEAQKQSVKRSPQWIQPHAQLHDLYLKVGDKIAAESEQQIVADLEEQEAKRLSIPPNAKIIKI